MDPLPQRRRPCVDMDVDMDMGVAPPLVSSIQRLHLGFTDFFGGRFALSSNPATPESSEFCQMALHRRAPPPPPAPDPPPSSGTALRSRLFREGAVPLFILGEAEIVRISKNADAKMVPLMVEDRGRSDDFVSAPSHGVSASEENVSSDDGGWIGKVAMASVQAKAMMKDISVLEKAQIGACAGGIAGAFTYACLHPLDTIKTKLQLRGASRLYSGPLDVVVKTFQEQGIMGFYNGISAVLVGSMFSSSVYFGTCELGKALLSQVPTFPPVAIPPLSGALGNIVSSAILVPKELITQRMQSGAKGRSWEVLLRIVQNEGVIGLYTGYSAALVRNLPASVLSFSSFEYLKSAWLEKTGKARLEPWQSVLSGALAGMISSALTTPLDVVKTRLMTQARSTYVLSGQGSLIEAELRAKIAASSYKGISSTLNKIWVEEGWRGLSRGIVPRVLYSAFFSALGYFAFETARLALVKRHAAKIKLSSHVNE